MRSTLSCSAPLWHSTGCVPLCAIIVCLLILVRVLRCVAGKTTLLVALIIYLRQAPPAPPPVKQVASRRHRILVVAHTNAAVDRIILGLAAAGFTGTSASHSTLLSPKTGFLIILSLIDK